MSEKKVKHVYKLCPCNRSNVEGIQSWLEDMAMDGLFLAEDGVFCGVFTFEQGLPKRVTYRLDVAQKRKPRFHGKRFQDLEAPELGIDSVRVYSNYGTLTVLMRHGNRVVHAVIMLDNDSNQNQWILWARAMAEKLR